DRHVLGRTEAKPKTCFKAGYELTYRGNVRQLLQTRRGRHRQRPEFARSYLLDRPRYRSKQDLHLSSKQRQSDPLCSARFSSGLTPQESALSLIAAQVGLVVLGAARIVGLAMQATPGAHQIVEHVGVEVLPVAALVLGLEVLAFGDEFRPARPF